tara:strand:+ start:322 stop:573 length:252 start_codon:yes stop_codon:yes gene_type:complete
MTTREKCQELYSKIAKAFENQSGGDYNDTMYYQLLGASEEMQEAEIDDDWEYTYKTLSDCWKYVEHCKKIDDLQQSMPNEVYC